MKKIKLILVLTFVIVTCLNLAFSQRYFPRQNLQKFVVSPFTRTTQADSIDVSIFMKIPYFALQYVKVDTQFIARYEAVIALQTKKGKQIGREVWQDSIVTNDYNATQSTRKNITILAYFKVPAGKYKIVASLLDLDTKNNSEQTRKLNMSDYKKDQFMHKPILLEKAEKYWGFKEGYIPAIKNATFDIEDGLPMYITGKVKPGVYTINTEFIDNDKKVLFQQSITDTSDTGIFEHMVTLPKDSVEGISINVRTELIQKRHKSDKSTKVIIRKAGISHLVSNIGDALHQMHYILEPNEKSELKKASARKQEKLFKKFWKHRDPTPETEINEMMNEYFRRVSYANVHFESFIDGWETDMGMIYIIYGPPNDIERYMVQQREDPYERWNYFRIYESFTFRGDSFGHYRLTTPYLGYRR